MLLTNIQIRVARMLLHLSLLKNTNEALLTQNWNRVQTLDMIGCIWARIPRIIKTLSVDTWCKTHVTPLSLLKLNYIWLKTICYLNIQHVAVLSMRTGATLTYSPAIIHKQQGSLGTVIFMHPTVSLYMYSHWYILPKMPKQGGLFRHCMRADFCLLIWFCPSEAA